MFECSYSVRKYPSPKNRFNSSCKNRARDRVDAKRRYVALVTLDLVVAQKMRACSNLRGSGTGVCAALHPGPPTLSTNVNGAPAGCRRGQNCALLFPPKEKIEKSVLDQIPIEVPHRESRGATLLVLPPETTPIYDTMQIAYRARPHEVAHFREREWGETPSQMLYPLLVRAVENTRAFSAVLLAPYTGPYTYALRTEILELTQDFTSESATLVFSLRFQLIDYEANQVIATKEISLHEPMQQKTSYAGVVAANDATAKALQEMAVFILEKTD